MLIYYMPPGAEGEKRGCVVLGWRGVVLEEEKAGILIYIAVFFFRPPSFFSFFALRKWRE